MLPVRSYLLRRRSSERTAYAKAISWNFVLAVAFSDSGALSVGYVRILGKVVC